MNAVSQVSKIFPNGISGLTKNPPRVLLDDSAPHHVLICEDGKGGFFAQETDYPYTLNTVVAHIASGEISFAVAKVIEVFGGRSVDVTESVAFAVSRGHFDYMSDCGSVLCARYGFDTVAKRIGGGHGW